MDLLPLFDFNERQLQLLHDKLLDVETALLNWRFNSPADDQLRIRQHAALSGERDCLLSLLNNDSHVLAEHEAAVAEATFTQE